MKKKSNLADASCSEQQNSCILHCVNFFNILIQYLQQFLFCSQKKKNPRSTFTRISYIEYSRHIRK